MLEISCSGRGVGGGVGVAADVGAGTGVGVLVGGDNGCGFIDVAAIGSLDAQTILPTQRQRLLTHHM